MMVNYLCRLCSSKERIVDVYHSDLDSGKELRQYISLASGIEILQNDPISRMVCHRCCEIAVKLHKYRCNAIANDKLLKEKCGQPYTPPITDKDELLIAASKILNISEEDIGKGDSDPLDLLNGYISTDSDQLHNTDSSKIDYSSNLNCNKVVNQGQVLLPPTSSTNSCNTFSITNNKVRSTQKAKVSNKRKSTSTNVTHTTPKVPVRTTSSNAKQTTAEAPARATVTNTKQTTPKLPPLATFTNAKHTTSEVPAHATFTNAGQSSSDVPALATFTNAKQTTPKLPPLATFTNAKHTTSEVPAHATFTNAGQSSPDVPALVTFTNAKQTTAEAPAHATFTNAEQTTPEVLTHVTFINAKQATPEVPAGATFTNTNQIIPEVPAHATFTNTKTTSEVPARAKGNVLKTYSAKLLNIVTPQSKTVNDKIKNIDEKSIHELPTILKHDITKSIITFNTLSSQSSTAHNIEAIKTSTKANDSETVESYSDVDTHPTIKKLLRENNFLQLPKEVYASNISPRVSLDPNAVSDWYALQLQQLKDKLNKISQANETSNDKLPNDTVPRSRLRKRARARLIMSSDSEDGDDEWLPSKISASDSGSDTSSKSKKGVKTNPLPTNNTSVVPVVHNNNQPLTTGSVMYATNVANLNVDNISQQPVNNSYQLLIGYALPAHVIQNVATTPDNALNFTSSNSTVLKTLLQSSNCQTTASLLTDFSKYGINVENSEPPIRFDSASDVPDTNLLTEMVLDTITDKTSSITNKNNLKVSDDVICISDDEDVVKPQENIDVNDFGNLSEEKTIQSLLQKHISSKQSHKLSQTFNPINSQVQRTKTNLIALPNMLGELRRYKVPIELEYSQVNNARFVENVTSAAPSAVNLWLSKDCIDIKEIPVGKVPAVSTNIMYPSNKNTLASSMTSNTMTSPTSNSIYILQRLDEIKSSSTRPILPKNGIASNSAALTTTNTNVQTPPSVQTYLPTTLNNISYVSSVGNTSNAPVITFSSNANATKPLTSSTNVALTTPVLHDYLRLPIDSIRSFVPTNSLPTNVTTTATSVVVNKSPPLLDQSTQKTSTASTLPHMISNNLKNTEPSGEVVSKIRVKSIAELTKKF